MSKKSGTVNFLVKTYGSDSRIDKEGTVPNWIGHLILNHPVIKDIARTKKPRDEASPDKGAQWLFPE